MVGRSQRDNTFTTHARGECHTGVEHGHHHGHGAIVQALADCQAVLCYGMGWRAAEDLQQKGIQAFILPREMSPEDAVNAYLAGNLGSAGDFCRCHG